MNLLEPLRRCAERSLRGAWRLAGHELDAAQGHLTAAREHCRVARRARDRLEFLRDQVDLLPATLSRLVSDHRQRVALLRGFWSPDPPTEG